LEDKIASRARCGRWTPTGRDPRGAARNSNDAVLSQGYPARSCGPLTESLPSVLPPAAPKQSRPCDQTAARPAGVVIAQQYPKHSQPFAKRMNDCCQMTDTRPRMATGPCGPAYMPPEPASHVYGWRPLRCGSPTACRSIDTNPRWMFCSARCPECRPQRDRVILTGMGQTRKRAQGDAGRGSQTIAQDEATSVVWGMPGEAVSLGPPCTCALIRGGKDTLTPDSMDITGKRARRDPD